MKTVNLQYPANIFDLPNGFYDIKARIAENEGYDWYSIGKGLVFERLIVIKTPEAVSPELYSDSSMASYQNGHWTFIYVKLPRTQP